MYLTVNFKLKHKIYTYQLKPQRYILIFVLKSQKLVDLATLHSMLNLSNCDVRRRQFLNRILQTKGASNLLLFQMNSIELFAGI